MSSSVKKITHATRVLTEAAELLNRHAHTVKSMILDDKRMQNEVAIVASAKVEYDQYKRVAKDLLNIAKVEE